MNRIRIPLVKTLSEWKPLSELPFMLFLTLVFLFIYAWTVVSVSRIREPVLLILFTALFLIHLILHWLVIGWMMKRWNLWIYLALQTTIVFILSSMTASIGPLIGLYMGLIGVSVGMFRGTRRIALAVFVVLAASGLNYFGIVGGSGMLWWALAVGPMSLFVVIYVVLYSRQAAAREKAQQLLGELAAANRRLTEYADRIEDLTLTGERQRMARELHDTLAQGLAGLVLQLEAADLHLAGGRPERAQAIIQQAMARARATLSDSRRAIDGLRKPAPEDLEEAVRAEAAHFESAGGAPCALDFSVSGTLSEEAQDLALRAVAEGLTNVARHAKAKRAWVKLRGDATMLTVEIGDDGAGFDPARDPLREGHYGLTGLRERARQAGGELEIESSAGKGSMLRMKIPVAG